MKNTPLLLGLNRHPRADRSFRYALLISGLVLLLLTVQATQAWASPTVNATTPAADTTSQLTSTVMTNHFSVYFVYPTSASPGQSEQISATTTATSSANIISFTIDISSYVNGQPLKLASQTILGYTTVQSGAKWQTSLTVNIPADAQAGPLIGTVTEVWQQPSNYYSSNYGGSYYYTPYYSMPYYTQSYPYYTMYNAYPYNTYNTQQYYLRYSNGYNTSPNNTPQYTRYSNGFIVMQTPPQSHMQSQSRTQLYMNRPSYAYQSSYLFRPMPYYAPSYYVPNYVTIYSPMYASNYATQVTSQQTVTLTYVT